MVTLGDIGEEDDLMLDVLAGDGAEEDEDEDEEIEDEEAERVQKKPATTRPVRAGAKLAKASVDPLPALEAEDSFSDPDSVVNKYSIYLYIYIKTQLL
jgi:hypothetical protein